jgi:rhamnose utilization protein RhaD (predicted bifunctional aldolase and dehydrogenase)/NAD(P)-dependent dehydrogenase (short-subunit alcohol dehydrogenase family)
MRSRYEAKAAQQFREQYGARWGNDLADRVYTSRLLGAEPALVLHGGGNTSVKSQAADVTGEKVDVLYVKGSGSDLGAIEPHGFPACRMAALLSHCQLPEMSDEQMVRGLRSQMLDPGSPTPSVEALLHAFVPAKFVDHTHADAVLGIVDTKNSQDLCREIWGDDLLFIPYVMPGFVLAQKIVEVSSSTALGAEKLRNPNTVMILDKHGIFTWGATAEESYERMIAAVTRAETYLAHRRATRAAQVVAAGHDSERQQLRRRIAVLLRGAVERNAEGFKSVSSWRDDGEILDLFAEPNARDLIACGTATPDHVIRTKPWPMWLPVASDTSDQALGALIQSELDAYRTRYCAYFEHNQARQATPPTRLDPLPRLIAVPGLGVLCLGKSLKEARIAGDIYTHTAGVIRNATSLGGYVPVSLPDLFDVEYWSLEQAKLKLQKVAAAPLLQHVALVTGAASGIGLATAEGLLAQGAHVMLSDIDETKLSAAIAPLAKRFGTQVASHVADIANESAVPALLDKTVDAFGGLDIVVSNAGNAPAGQLHTADGEQALLASLKLNLLSHQRLAHHAAQLMIRQGTGGCLLFNASKSAFNPGPDFGPYAVPKAALVSLMKQYAIDLAKHGIRSNAINADRIRTAIFSPELLESRAKARGVAVDDYFKANLLHRETTAKDVADAFVFLACAKATTGAVLPVDGGNPAAFPR